MISLHSDIDLAEYSPLIRGMALSLCYARDNQGIGLTQSGALNRKFVTWAADAFNWPEYTVNELYVVNKVLNEQDMPPLWPIHALLKHFKLLRRSKGLLKATKAGVSLAERPRDLFDLVALSTCTASTTHLIQSERIPYITFGTFFSMYSISRPKPAAP